jgi:uncharacterized delta-60 repeat protein
VRGGERFRAPIAALLGSVAAMGILLVAPAGGHAQVLRGVLDRSFGHGGRAFSHLGRTLADSEFTSLARQADGKLLLTGWTKAKGRYEQERIGFVERRDASGGLDRSFGVEGTVAAGEIGVYDEKGVSSLAVQSDGAILFGDSANQCTSSGAVHRLLADGAPDPSFGTKGISASLPLTVDHLAVDAMGRIVVAGTLSEFHCGKNGGASELAAARLLPDGALDPGFGAGGVVRMGELGVTGTSAGGLAVRGDGAVLVAGTEYGGAGDLVALTPSGALDPGFGASGIVHLTSGPRAMLMTAGGDLIVAGTESLLFCCHKEGDFILSRYTPSGALDPSFGEAGIAKLAVGDVNEATALAEAAGGEILLAGQTAASDSCDPGECAFTPVLLRVDASGALDTGFGEGGWVALAQPRPPRVSGNSPHTTALAVGSGGQVLAAGSGGRGSDGFVFARTAAGDPDPSFGEGGAVYEVRTLPSSSEAVGVAIKPGGGILVSAWSDVGRRGARPLLLGFRPNGRPDRHVGGGSGFVRTNVGGALRIGARRWAYMVQPTFGGKRGYVSRFDPLGRRDEHYGSDGTADLPAKFLVFSFMVRRNGGVLLLGRMAGRHGMAAFQLDPRGDPGLGFGRNGLALVGFRFKAKVEAQAATVDSRERVVLLGRVGARAVGTRLLPNGRLDRRFAHRGRLVIENDFWVGSTALALGTDGGILVATSPEPAKVGDVTLRRFGPGGSPDRSFGDGGEVRVRQGGTPRLSILADRRQILVALARGGWGEGGVTLRAYRPDGAVDRRFGDGGVVMAATSRRRAFRLTGVGRQSDGRLVVAGTSGEIGALGARVELLRFR